MTHQDRDSAKENTAHSTLTSLILYASSMKRLISSSILCELSVSYFTRSVPLFQSLFLAGFKRGLSFRGRITKNGNTLRGLITDISHHSRPEGPCLQAWGEMAACVAVHPCGGAFFGAERSNCARKGLCDAGLAPWLLSAMLAKVSLCRALA